MHDGISKWNTIWSAVDTDFCFKLFYNFIFCFVGIKNNDGGTYSDIEAKSLVYKMNQIAIYSNSWGESDDTNFGGPDSIVQGALSRGVKLVSFLQLKHI